MTTAPGYLVAEQDVEARRAPDDTVEERVTIDRSVGCERLEQRVLRFDPGRSASRTVDGALELLYVVSGNGTLLLERDAYPLEPGTGAFVVDGETYEVDNPGPDPMHVVAVRAPAEEPVGERKVIVRYDDQPALPATPNREFRYLVNQDAGCRDVTQFVGVIPPGRAPLHSHVYDEVVYVIEGDGVLHLNDRHEPLGPGSCVHLPPLQMHCLENVGDTPMRVLGVFHPSGDPASKAAVANE